MDSQQTTKVQTVVQGEASESEEENEKPEVENSRVPPFSTRVLHNNPPKSQALGSTGRKGGGHAVVVAGEASESDEEEVEVDTSTSEKGSPTLPPLKVDRSRKLDLGSSSDLSDVPMLLSPRMAESKYNKPKYDTLLHRKLRENNWQLQEHMVEVAGQAYLGAARNLSATTTQFVKSLSIIQDVSHSMRLLTNDLFHLDDRIDIIRSCKLLPDIIIPETTPVVEAAQAAAPSAST